MSHIPHLERRNDKTVLIVHDQPLILLAGEVHNSNSSSLEYMESVWEKAEALGMNALLLPVAWETVEPREGQFDFALVDGLITQARQRGKHLVLLWFGSWKNAECMYAPAWVKTDLARFRRAQIVKGKNKAPRKEMYGIPYTSLSYLCEETRDADARAFARLMAHLREFDGEENTVVAVQVENETGLLGAAREVSDEADALFIPECATHSYAAPRLAYAVGHYHAMCYAPFGFEDMGMPFNAMQGYLFGMDVTDPALKTPQDVEEYGWFARTLNELMPLLAERIGTSKLQAVCSERKEDCVLDFGDFRVMAAFDHPMLAKKDGVCLGIQTAPDECILLVNRCGLMFASGREGQPNLDILSLEEGEMQTGHWKTIRRLNGDEAAFMKYDAPVLLRLKVFIYD